MIELTDKQKAVIRQRKWRAANREKVKEQKKRYHKKTYIRKLPKLYESETEQQRARKRLDTVLLVDSYLKDNIARRLKIDIKDVPQGFIDVCRPLLQVKRKMKDLKVKSNWISVKDYLPKREIEVLIFYDGYINTGYNAHSPLDDTQYWINSEIGCGLPVTHWMLLPEPPKE